MRWLSVFALGACLAGAAHAQEPEAPGWSVLILTVDALRADRMGVYGHTENTTPYLEGFAEEAVFFDRAFATGGWTSPGMVSMLTGYTPLTHQQHARHTEYDDAMPSALRVLREEGLQIVGKAKDGGTFGGLGIGEQYGRGSGLEALIDHWAAHPDERFLTWVHVKPTHLPYDPSPYNRRRFGGDAHQSPAIDVIREWSVVFKDPGQVPSWLPHPGEVRFDEADITTVRALYDGCVADADDQVGRAIEAMRARGLLDRTIVIISADHGEELFEHGWVGHASTGYEGTLYDELTHIPLIIRVPGTGWAGHREALVDQTDVMPTIFDLLDLDPARLEVPMQGHSLVPVMAGATDRVREVTVAHSTVKGWTTPEAELGERITAVRSLHHKLVLWPDGRREYLDLVRDPGEQEPAAAPGEGFPDLDAALGSWRQQGQEAAGQLVVLAGERHLEAMQGDLAEGRVDQALEEARAVAQIHRTWSYADDPVLVGPWARRWHKLRRRVAAEARRAADAMER